MKRMAILFAALLVFAQCALAAEYAGEGYAFALPDGFDIVEGALLDGYREAASADAGAAFAGESMLALAGEKSISIVSAATDAGGAAEAAAEVVREYAAYIPGFADVVPEEFDAHGRAFVRLAFSVDGERAVQIFSQHGGTLFVLTFMGMDDAEVEAALSGFAPAAAAEGEGAE